MTRTLLRAVTGALVATAAPVYAQTAAPQPPPAAAAPEWRSMAGAKVAVPLPATGPMAADLAARPAPPKWADVPLPPPPTLKAAPGTTPAAAESPAGAKAPAPQDYVAAPAGAASAAAGASLSAAPAAQEYTAPGGPDGSKEPKVNMAVDQTGAMMTVTQDLESDKLRLAWAQAGGTLPAFEGNLGMILMYKDLSKEAGAGAYMNGVGFSGGIRVALLTLEPPSYERRDKSWTAWKLGVGGDVGVTSVTITTPVKCYAYVGCVGGNQSASMSSTTLVMTLGFMKAFGSFDSPTDWSGFAIGAEWAPSQQRTVMTTEDGKSTSSSSFNARGFALNFESGSLRSMASKMGKKARMKVSIFFLPPAGDLPFLMTTTIGAVWY